MKVRRTVNRAFTLVEILIVVVILGILAAIVVPQFSKAADDARAGNIATQLSTIQNAIELYRAREGTYPTLDAASGWSDLMGGTDNLDGTFTPVAGETQYLKDIPRNPADPTNTYLVAQVNGATYGSAAAGWVFNTDDYQIYASYYVEDPNAAANPLEVTTTATD